MKKLRSKIVNLGLILLTTSSICFSQKDHNHPPKNPPTFAQLLEKMDTNNDGKLSATEVKGH